MGVLNKNLSFKMGLNVTQAQQGMDSYWEITTWTNLGERWE